MPSIAASSSCWKRTSRRPDPSPLEHTHPFIVSVDMDAPHRCDPCELLTVAAIVATALLLLWVSTWPAQGDPGVMWSGVPVPTMTSGRGPGHNPP